MRSVLLGVFVVLFLSIACSGAQEDPLRLTEEYPLSRLEFPDDFGIHYEDAISDHQKEVVEFSVELARKKFQEAGFPLRGNVYILATKEAYAQKLISFGANDEKAYEAAESTAGITLWNSGTVLINIELLDDLLRDSNGLIHPGSRDYGLAFVTLHELQHVLQAQLSYGWNMFAFWYHEATANVGAYTALAAATCMMPIEIIYADHFPFERDCDEGEVKDKVIDELMRQYIGDGVKSYALFIFLLDQFGLSAIDIYSMRSLPTTLWIFLTAQPAKKQQSPLKKNSKSSTLVLMKYLRPVTGCLSRNLLSRPQHT